MCPPQATEPITHETTFQIWTRVSLRTVQDSYPVFNKQSLRACMAAQRLSLQSASQYAQGQVLNQQRPPPVAENSAVAVGAG